VTTSTYRVDLLKNPNFDGSTRGWKSSLAGNIGLIPLYFPKNDPEYATRKHFGHFHEHISGRPSDWAFRNGGSRMDRNYSCFLSAPPTTSLLRPEFSLYQDVPVSRLFSESIDGSGQKYQLCSSSWVRVDKVWGEPGFIKLFFTVQIMTRDVPMMEYRKDLDPTQVTAWQYASLDSGPIVIPRGATRIRVSVGLKASVGSIFVDDFFLSLRPVYA